MLEDGKSKLKSRSIWASLMALIPVVDQALVLTGVLPLPVLGDAVAIVTAAVGNIAAIVFRIKAEKKLK
jgi:hypothetical protein